MTMIREVLLTGALIFSVACSAVSVRNSSGRVVGRTHEQGNRTIYRDGSGRVTGTSRQMGNTTYFRDGSGRMKGSSTQVGGTTVYRDSSGRTQGTARQVGNQVIFRDASGRVTGTATRTGNRTIYRDGSGRVQGSADKALPAPDKTIYGLKKGKKKKFLIRRCSISVFLQKSRSYHEMLRLYVSKGTDKIAAEIRDALRKGVRKVTEVLSVT